jgi:hypothetical protein
MQGRSTSFELVPGFLLTFALALALGAAGAGSAGAAPLTGALRGVIVLTNAETHVVHALTLWDSQEALEESGRVMDGLRDAETQRAR